MELNRKEGGEETSQSVRPRPRIGDKSRIEYQIDEIVEVFTRNQKWEPEGWWKATIKNKKGLDCQQIIWIGNFFYVAYDNVDKYDEIVEKNRLRPINTKENLKPTDYNQIQIAVASELQDWAQNIEESNKSLAEIRTKSNSLIVSFDNERKHINVAGKEENIETSKLLLDVVLSHQAEVMQHFAANQEEALPNQEHISDFAVIEEDIYNCLGGIKGEYFELVKSRHNVELDIGEGSIQGGKCKIVIIASNSKTIQLAKKDLLLFSCLIPLTIKQASYLKTKLPDLQQKSKIVCTTEVNPSEEGKTVIKAIGSEESLKNFRLAIETSLEYESKIMESVPKPEIKQPEPPPHEEPISYPKQKRGSRGTTYRYVKKQ